MIVLPYGIADFHRIRREGMVYLDRTAYIREIERLGSALVFLRPRRFGKSLWLQTLANYYDLRLEGEFGRLFGELAIGREPTPLRNRFFVLQWNFSLVDPSGGIDKIAASLEEQVRSQTAAFVSDYRAWLPAGIDLEGSPPAVLTSVLSAIRQTPHKLYLLIDEYDNFVNELMASDVETYRAVVGADGPFKLLFKAVKNATEGRGLERVFITGVSPVALNDLTSGFNIAKDVSLAPELASLCGFREGEIRALLGRIAAEIGLSAQEVDGTLETMRTWYNGYRFSTKRSDFDDHVYNPTNAFYFLDHLYRRKTPPEQLYDENLRTDRHKLAFLARAAAGAGVVERLTEGNGEIDLPRLVSSFPFDNLTARLGQDQGAVASFLYYMGMLTLADRPGSLEIPNLVVKKLFLDRLLEIFLPDISAGYAAQETALRFFQSGELAPLLGFFEERLLSVLSNRDRGTAPREAGQAGSGVNEMVIKTLLLSMLFDDTRYVTFSELELAQGFADLCLLVRPEMRHRGFFDLLFEIKLVRRKDLAKSSREIGEMREPELRKIPAVAKAFEQAREQALRYREALVGRFAEGTLKLCGYVVVAVGLERIFGEEVLEV